MLKPDKPADETKRLSTLRRLNILDTAPEERFDRLTRLAQRLFNVPIALVSLVDVNRQWFKSCQGLGVSETSRDISFCGHAILGDDIFYIPNTLEDERFADNPLVTEDPHIRFYAGCPLFAPDGSKLGTLCIIDNVPHELIDDDFNLLHDLANMAQDEINGVVLATTDELTSLSNRRGFSALCQQTLELCKRIDRQVALLFFDLDGFKQINDNFGHAVGDQALMDFSDILKKTFRQSDVVGRIGGDEFVVLITDTDTSDTDYLLNRFKANIDNINTSSGRNYSLAYSVGTIQFDSNRHNSLCDLISDADTLMYEKKSQNKQD